jgi:hypothetical protein
MRKHLFPLFTFLFFVVLNANIFAQTTNGQKTVTISYSWTRIKSFGSNQVAIWIEKADGRHIRTLFATKYTATGGYIHRPLSLSEWTQKFNLKEASKEQVDAITGSTPKSGMQTVVWDGKDQHGKTVEAGTYIVRMEANIHDADKMFFRGIITIGGEDAQTTGEITYSKPELAAGNTLFKNVLVEYK